MGFRAFCTIIHSHFSKHSVCFGCYVRAVEQLLLVLVGVNPPLCAQTVNCLQKFNTNLLHNTFLLLKSFTCFGLAYWPENQAETCGTINQ
jgi:hypothetical protein